MATKKKKTRRKLVEEKAVSRNRPHSRDGLVRKKVYDDGTTVGIRGPRLMVPARTLRGTGTELLWASTAYESAAEEMAKTVEGRQILHEALMRASQNDHDKMVVQTNRLEQAYNEIAEHESGPYTAKSHRHNVRRRTEFEHPYG